MIKDFLGSEVSVDDYFAYPLSIGRSNCMALYQLKVILDDGRVKARKVVETGGLSAYKYKLFEYDAVNNTGQYVDMTPEQRQAVDRKTSVLNMFQTRACKVEYTEGKE